MITTYGKAIRNILQLLTIILTLYSLYVTATCILVQSTEGCLFQVDTKVEKISTHTRFHNQSNRIHLILYTYSYSVNGTRYENHQFSNLIIYENKNLEVGRIRVFYFIFYPQFSYILQINWFYYFINILPAIFVGCIILLAKRRKRR